MRREVTGVEGKEVTEARVREVLEVENKEAA